MSDYASLSLGVVLIALAFAVTVGGATGLALWLLGRRHHASRHRAERGDR